MNTTDNIVGNATSTNGAISILRLSGPDVLDIAQKLWQGKSKICAENERKMLLGKVALDQAMAVYMKAPRSYTGDDVVEFHCHGGALVAANVLKAILNENCRMAEGGEFTFRAFANGKIDLLQAEAIGDIISSNSEHSLKMAERQLAGGVSERIDNLYEQLSSLLAECESDLDFPEEMIQWEQPTIERFNFAKNYVQELIDKGKSGAVFRDGVNVALAGRPNAGKSSLFNLLLGKDRSIVTDIPGTTRDTVDCDCFIKDIPVHLSDTAGLRQTDEIVEKLGVERSNKIIKNSQIIFWVLDASAEDLNLELNELMKYENSNIIAVWNKIDLITERKLPNINFPTIEISAKNNQNIDKLAEIFLKIVNINKENELLPEFALNVRCLHLLESAQENIKYAQERFVDGDSELAAAELHRAIEQIGDIIGKSANPDILNEIFTNFCIGK